MKRKRVIITIIICIIILFGATIFSISKFNVWNPFSSCLGMLEILFTDKEYTIVQNYPSRVVFCKTSDTSDASNKTSIQYLDEYMENRGLVLEEQLGGIFIYSNGSIKEYISFSENGYFSRWEWE